MEFGRAWRRLTLRHRESWFLATPPRRLLLSLKLRRAAPYSTRWREPTVRHRSVQRPIPPLRQLSRVRLRRVLLNGEGRRRKGEPPTPRFDAPTLRVATRFGATRCRRAPTQFRSEERRVGKSVDLGGRRIIK